jgi:putative ABC transport system ATP-binding protein
MMLSLQQVSKVYTSRRGTVSALDRVSLELPAGRLFAIRGPSGCGKTTLLLTAGTMLSPDAGTVKIAGELPYQMSADDRACFRARSVGFVFQRFHLIPYLNVRDNVLAPEVTRGRRFQVEGNEGTARHGREDRSWAEELLERFGLSDRAEHYPAELSTGECQRCALARALFLCPRLLLADEPTGNLDRANAEIVLRALREFANSGGAVLLVTHDASAAASHADQIIEMRAGCLLSDNGRGG